MGWEGQGDEASVATWDGLRDTGQSVRDGTWTYGIRVHRTGVFGRNCWDCHLVKNKK